jgi:hypothetical protein
VDKTDQLWAAVRKRGELQLLEQQIAQLKGPAKDVQGAAQAALD